MIGDYLKRADKYILKNDFDAAEDEINIAIGLEPNNVYVKAYVERIDFFRRQHIKKNNAEKVKKALSRPEEQTLESTVMLIDDEADFRHILGVLLASAGYTVVPIITPEGAIKKLATLVPDIILCDINFVDSDLDGFSIYEHVRQNPKLSTVPFIFISGVKDKKTRRISSELGVDDFIAKPFSGDMILAAVEGKIKRFRQMRK